MNKDESISRSRFFFYTLAGIAIICLVALMADITPSAQSKIAKSSFAKSSIADAVANTPNDIPAPKLNIQHWESALGTKVYFIHSSQPELLDIQLDFNSGSVRDGEQFGLSELTAQLLGSATKDKSENEIAQRFEQEGSQFYSQSGYERISVQMRSLSEKKHLLPSIELLKETLSQPVFSQNNLNKVRNRLLDTIKASEKQPRVQSILRANELIFTDLPYSHPKTGTAKTLPTITPAQVDQFHKTYFTARNMTLSLVGDITREQAEQISEQISLAFPTGTEAEPPTLPHSKNKGVNEHIEEDTSQVFIIMASIAPPRNTTDYAALFMANEILGGDAFGSILLSEIREKQGLAYSIYSGLYGMRYTGKFYVMTSTRSEKMHHSLSEIKRLLADFIDQGPTEEHLNATKKIILGGIPMQIASNHSLLSLIADIGFYQLPINATEQLFDAIQSLTTQQVKDAFANMISMETLTTITAGNAPEEVH